MIETVSCIEEIENLYKTGANAPYEKILGGFGYHGVLIKEMAPGNIQCHSCGRFFRHLPTHTRQAHGLLADDYRDMYGFSRDTPLVHAELSAKFRKSAIERLRHYKAPLAVLQKNAALGRKVMAERRKVRGFQYSEAKLNERNICPEQVMRRYLVIADFLGHEPSAAELQDNDLAAYKAIHNRFGTLNAFREKYGFQTRKWVGRPLEADAVLLQIRDFCKTNKFVPKNYSQWDKARNGYCAGKTILNHFGSWNRALVMAGVK